MCMSSCTTAAMCWASPATERSCMVRTLLIRGMLVGLLAGLLAFGFSKTFGEPPIDRAIAVEAAIDQAKAKADAAMGMVHEPETELVSRWVQAGPGLFTGVVVYSAAFGGLFALGFATANGRIEGLVPRGVAALLAAAGFVSVTLVPSLKYPASPPAVGAPEAIGVRTAMFFLMLLISIVAMAGAAMLRDRLAPRQGGWTAALTAAAGYVIVVA